MCLHCNNEKLVTRMCSHVQRTCLPPGGLEARGQEVGGLEAGGRRPEELEAGGLEAGGQEARG